MIFKKRPVLIISLIALLVLAAAGAAFAEADPIGKVAELRGMVKSMDEAGAERVLSRDAPVHLNDSIITGPEGRAGIRFTDGTYLAVGPESEVTIDEYLYTPRTKSNAFSIGAVKGLFLVIAGKIAEYMPDGFTASTPLAMVGIRGTSFAFMYDISPDLVKQFNRTKKDPGGLTVSPENFYATSLEGAAFVANKAGTAELDEVCKYCWVEPTRISRLAFLENFGPAAWEGRGVTVSDAGPRPIVLARAQPPDQGSTPKSECEPAVAEQFAEFLSTVFSGFGGHTSSWVPVFSSDRGDENLNPPTPITGPPPGAGGGGGGGCFLPDTKVLMADGSYREISRIEKGDMVRSYNPEKDAVENKEVLRTYTFPSREYYLINGMLKATALHPFLMAGPETVWKKASELEVGDRVKSVHGVMVIRSIEIVKTAREIEVYNFRVADSKNYLVVDENGPYVVHNGL